MRVYLVIMDETEEARAALRFATRRAADTEGAVHILSVVEPQDFTAFGAVGATIEQEAHDRAEVLATSAAGNIASEGGRLPTIAVRTGSPSEVIRDYLAESADIAALVLGAAREGAPGPLVTHFSQNVGALPCPLIIVPGALSDEAIDTLS